MYFRNNQKLLKCFYFLNTIGPRVPLMEVLLEMSDNLRNYELKD